MTSQEEQPQAQQQQQSFIFVRNLLDGKRIKFVSLSDIGLLTRRQVDKFLNAAAGISSETKYRLTFRGTELGPKTVLKDAGVVVGSTLLLEPLAVAVAPMTKPSPSSSRRNSTTRAPSPPHVPQDRPTLTAEQRRLLQEKRRRRLKQQQDDDDDHDDKLDVSSDMSDEESEAFSLEPRRHAGVPPPPRLPDHLQKHRPPPLPLKVPSSGGRQMENNTRNHSSSRPASASSAAVAASAAAGGQHQNQSSCLSPSSPSSTRSSTPQSYIVIKNTTDNKRYRFFSERDIGELTGSKVREFLRVAGLEGDISMRLSFKGREVLDSESLKDAGVEMGNTMEVSRGPPPPPLPPTAAQHQDKEAADERPDFPASGSKMTMSKKSDVLPEAAGDGARSDRDNHSRRQVVARKKSASPKKNAEEQQQEKKRASTREVKPVSHFRNLSKARERQRERVLDRKMYEQMLCDVEEYETFGRMRLQEDAAFETHKKLKQIRARLARLREDEKLDRQQHKDVKGKSTNKPSSTAPAARVGLDVSSLLNVPRLRPVTGGGASSSSLASSRHMTPSTAASGGGGGYDDTSFPPPPPAQSSSSRPTTSHRPTTSTTNASSFCPNDDDDEDHGGFDRHAPVTVITYDSSRSVNKSSSSPAPPMPATATTFPAPPGAPTGPHRMRTITCALADLKEHAQVSKEWKVPEPQWYSGDASCSSSARRYNTRPLSSSSADLGQEHSGSIIHVDGVTSPHHSPPVSPSSSSRRRSSGGASPTSSHRRLSRSRSSRSWKNASSKALNLLAPLKGSMRRKSASGVVGGSTAGGGSPGGNLTRSFESFLKKKNPPPSTVKVVGTTSSAAALTPSHNNNNNQRLSASSSSFVGASGGVVGGQRHHHHASSSNLDRAASNRINGNDDRADLSADALVGVPLVDGPDDEDMFDESSPNAVTNANDSNNNNNNNNGAGGGVHFLMEHVESGVMESDDASMMIASPHRGKQRPSTTGSATSASVKSSATCANAAAATAATQPRYMVTAPLSFMSSCHQKSGGGRGGGAGVVQNKHSELSWYKPMRYPRPPSPRSGGWLEVGHGRRTPRSAMLEELDQRRVVISREDEG